MKILRKHQKPMLHYMRSVQHPALFVEMRLGKTLVTIRCIKTYSNCKYILVVAPYSALYSWEMELREEGVTTIHKLFGTREERLEVLDSIPRLTNEKQWVLINKEGYLTVPEIADYAWDVVILDESTFIKTPYKRKKDKATKIQYYSPKITHFFLSNFRDTKHRIILTGTPAPESELDYFTQLQFLDESILPYQNYYHFRRACFHEFGYTFVMKQGAKVQLAKRLSRYCYTLKRQDVRLGGQKIYEIREVELPPSARRAYTKLEREFIIDLEGVYKSTIFATEKYTWLRRLCGGYFACDDYKQTVHTAKVEELKELMAGELNGQQLIIWCAFVEEIENLEADLTAEGYDVRPVWGKIPQATRAKLVNDFQHSRFQVLIAQPECFKMGLDLSVASTMIYYSTPLGGETRQQSEDRIVNVARTDSLLIIDLVCRNTVESDVIIPSLHAKESRQQMLHRLIGRFQNVA